MSHRIIIAILVYTFSILTAFGQNEEIKLMKDYVNSLKKILNNDSIFIQQNCSPNIWMLNPKRQAIKTIYHFIDTSTVNEMISNKPQQSKTFKEPKEIFINKSKVEYLINKNEEFRKSYLNSDSASVVNEYYFTDTLGFIKDISPYIILTFTRPVFNHSKTVAYVEVIHSSFGRLLSTGTGHILRKHNNVWIIEKGISKSIIN